MTPFNFNIQNRCRKRSNLVKARNAILKKLFVPQPVPSIEVVRARGRVLARREEGRQRV